MNNNKSPGSDGFRGEDLNVIFYQNMPNLHNRYISAERKISQKNPEYMLYYSMSCNQTLVEWSLDGPLSKLCPVIPTYNQDGRQAKNRKKGGSNFNCPLLL
jgi:hypothetical protein